MPVALPPPQLPSFYHQNDCLALQNGFCDVIHVNCISVHKVAKNMLGEPLHFRLKPVDGGSLNIYSWKQKTEEKQKELGFVTQLVFDSFNSFFRVWITIKVRLQCQPDLKNTHAAGSATWSQESFCR